MLLQAIPSPAPGEENLPVRWAALLGALGEADTRRVLKRLRCSNACIEETAVLVRETAGKGVCRSFSEDRPLGWDPAAAIRGILRVQRRAQRTQPLHGAQPISA